jgi:hypothetical protein
MNMETEIEYYYGETLRWSFGFDNPNKAAVIFACAIPLLWWLWRMAWRPEKLWLRIPALLVSASLLAGAWYCLIMTFSRGGLVAAGAALLYQTGRAMWADRKQAAGWRKSASVWATALLVAGLIGGTVWNGLGSRSAEALGKDASVGNRIELWGGAAQMAAENPLGFGTGKSGEQYMQWYQPLDRHQGYRTMVNSYLTFLVEQGWLWTLAAVAGFTLFWAWTNPTGDVPFPTALRASILAFLITGVFSTTMEEWRLWIFPGCAAGLLICGALWKRRPLEMKSLIPAGACVLAGCAALWCAGILKSRQDPLKREFAMSGPARGVSSLSPGKPKSRSLGCIVDEAVMGDQYARLLREMALGAEVKILLGDRVNDAERILCAGKNVHSYGTYSHKPLFLLAPQVVPEKDLSTLAARGEPARIILPEIDEDGRVEFWEDMTTGPLKADFHTTALSGVGNRVDWAWSEVIELVKGG